MVADGEVPIVLDDGKLEAENHCVSRLSSTLLGGGPHEGLVVVRDSVRVVLAALAGHCREGRKDGIALRI